MNILRISLFFGLLSVLPFAFADSAAEKEAGKLLNTMGMGEAMTQSMAKMIDLQLKQNPTLAPYKGVMMKFFSKHMSWESLKPEFLAIYVDAFTANELREINGFYATDAGKKTIAKMPTLMAQGGQIGAARVQANIGELQAMIKAEAKRLQESSQ
tara:strand:+ start:133 stop:597 length:465 start_codon:yes stop_codon:yes gene_type:complete